MNCGTIEGVFATVDFGVENEEKIKNNFELQQKYNKGGNFFFYLQSYNIKILS